MNIEALKKIAAARPVSDVACIAGLREKKASVKTASVWDDVKSKINSVMKQYENMSPGMRALIGAGVGLGGGALLGKLTGGTGKGAVLGAVAGAGTGAYWNDVRKAIDAVKPVSGNAAHKTKLYAKALYDRVVGSGENKTNDSASESKAAAKATEVAQNAAGV